MPVSAAPSPDQANSNCRSVAGESIAPVFDARGIGMEIGNLSRNRLQGCLKLQWKAQERAMNIKLRQRLAAGDGMNRWSKGSQQTDQFGLALKDHLAGTIRCDER